MNVLLTEVNALVVDSSMMGFFSGDVERGPEKECWKWC